MSTFFAEWGLAILISLAILAVLIWAEWRDHRDGLYDDDDDDHRSTPGEDLEVLRCIFCQRTIDWPVTALWPGACLYCDRGSAYTADRHPTPSNLGTDWRTVGPYAIDRDPADH